MASVAGSSSKNKSSPSVRREQDKGAAAGSATPNPTAEAESAEDALYPIAVLLDELRHDNVRLRLNAHSRIKTIAKALGPDRTRTELVPYLTETVDDEDEVLYCLAGELGDFLDAIGGLQYAGNLTDALEHLSAIEETMVREKAIESLQKISEATLEAPDGGRDYHATYFYPLVKRCATGDWFTIRISACSLLPTMYMRAPDNSEEIKEECIAMFKTLADDETPMVRRAATCNLGPMAEAVHETDERLVEKEFFPMFKTLARDEQDSVRLLIVEMAVYLARLLPAKSVLIASSVAPPSIVNAAAKEAEKENRSPLVEVEMIPIVKQCSQDSSWRVRYMVADKLADLCTSFGVRMTWKNIIPYYVRLLKDPEPEVRTASAYKLSDIARALFSFSEDDLPKTDEGNDQSTLDLIGEHILPVIKNTVSDPSPHVRAAFALSIIGVAPLMTKQETALNEVLALIMVLIKDQQAEVRLNVISHLDVICSVVTKERLNSELLPAVTTLAQDRNWRVRAAIIMHMPALARQLGREYFTIDRTLGALSVQWLKDCVFAIREAAMENFKALTKMFGNDWSVEHIVPQIVKLYRESKNYVYRIAALSTMATLSKELGQDITESCFVAIITDGACKDPVPNVRFGAAKTLQEVVPIVGELAREMKIKPTLEAMTEKPEKDVDVRFYAARALEALAACR